MARMGALLLENEALAAAAVIAAQATLGGDGFRQRDVRFFLEVFSNWLQSTTGSWTLDLHNAQVQRFLDQLASAGFAKRPGRKPPRYQLTPEGLLELLRRLGQRKSLKRLDEFFLIYHIFDAYGERLRALVRQSGSLASRSIAFDLDELLDPKRLIARERASVKREIARLDVRVDESRKTSELTRKLLAEGLDLAEVISAVEKRFPYELNSQKPLSELFEQLPAPFRQVELETVAELRALGLWGPTRELLVAYDGILERLSSLAPARVARRRGG